MGQLVRIMQQGGLIFDLQRIKQCEIYSSSQKGFINANPVKIMSGKR